MSENGLDYYIALIGKLKAEIDTLKEEIAVKDGFIDGLKEAIKIIEEARRY
jgi:hypothetical protein